MTPEFNQKLCDTRHENLEREIKHLRTDFKGLNDKYDKLIVLLYGNLIAVIGGMATVILILLKVPGIP